MTEPEVVDSPTAWVADHIRMYVESDGAQGHDWRGTPTLLLTVKGRKTGASHRTALIYGREGADVLVVASKGGDPKHPSWYLNLVSNPEVEVQIGAEKFTAVARTAEGDERDRLWPLMAAIWPDYDKYQATTERQIPLVVLTPA